MDASFPKNEQAPPRGVVEGDPETISDVLRPHSVPFETLKPQFPFLPLLRTLLGSAPNALMLTMIYPPAFRIENTIVPPLLGLPSSVFGVGQDLRIVGLAMYAASREHGCQYCSLHCCTMALRRGLREGALDLGDDLSAAEAAAVKLGKALGAVPPRMTKEVHAELYSSLSAVDATGCMMGAVMMGWLGRVMDALGLDLESPLVDEVGDQLRARGWTTGKHAVAEPHDPIQVPVAGPPRRGDGFMAKLEILQCVPSALMYDIRSTYGVPSGVVEVANYLRDNVGVEFGVLGRLESGPARRAIALAVVSTTVDPAASLPLALKGAIGGALAYAARDSDLLKTLQTMASFAPPDGNVCSVEPSTLVGIVMKLAEELHDAKSCEAGWHDAALSKLRDGGCSERDAVAATLGLAISQTPVVISKELVGIAKTALKPAEMVEIIAWMGVVGMFVRLNAFFSVVQ